MLQKVFKPLTIPWLFSFFPLAGSGLFEEQQQQKTTSHTLNYK